MSNATDIQRLRDTTGAGVMECKKALEEAHGNFERAVQIVQEHGLVKFEKRAGRETGAGLIETYVHNNRIGVMLEIRAETDFVVRSEPFRVLAHELTMHIAAAAPANVDELLKQLYIKDETKTVSDVIKGTAAQVGENIKVKQFYRIEL